MANPNIVAVTEIYGKTAVLAVTTSATAVVSNSAASGKLIKVNSLILSNVDDTNAVSATVDLYRGSTATRLIKSVSISINTAFTAIDKSVVLYLEEGDSIRITASANNDVEAVCSYEEIISV